MWPWHRCRAFRECKSKSNVYYGRCDLKKNHLGDHALERGLIIMRWSTNWTGYVRADSIWKEANG